MKTAITEMFGIDVPILAFTHCRDVVAAVSKAGGMGVLGAVGHSDRQLEIDLDWIEAEIGDRPYGVDLIVPAKYAGSDEGGLTIADLVAHDPRRAPCASSTTSSPATTCPSCPPTTSAAASCSAASGAAPFSANRADPQLEIALAHRPALVVNALGPPPAHMIERVKEAGRTVGALAGAAQHAERHVNAGVDVIIAQGGEAGGHTGEIGTMVLIPEIVDAVGDIPVLGAGGIGRGRQMAAAMALGAQGVWCGSVWLTTDEAETHPAVKQKFLAAHSSRHGPLAVAHRQAGPPAASRPGPTSGTARHTRPARHAAAADPRRRGDPPHRPRRPPRRARAPSSSPTTSSARSSAR